MKIAVWGVGPHAIKNILPAIWETDGLELSGVLTRNSKVRKYCEKTYNCVAWNSSKEMLEDMTIDVVYSCSPIELHYSQGLSTLKSGKHFWSEKSFTSSLEQTTELVNFSIEKNLTLAEGFMYVHHPQFKFLKQKISELDVSELTYINAKFTIPFPDDFEQKYLLEKNGLSGTSLLNIGVYPISAALYLIDYEFPVILSKSDKFYLGSDFVLNTHVVLQFPSGVVCSLMWGMDLSYRNEIDILTSKSSIASDRIFAKDSDYKPTVSSQNQTGVATTVNIKPSNHFINMFTYFMSLETSSENANIERERILRQARLNNKIKNYVSNP